MRRVDPTTTLEGFDVGFNPKLNKAQLFDLATCTFIEATGTSSFTARPGSPRVNRQALAHEACRRGYEVLFISTAKMLAHLVVGQF